MPHYEHFQYNISKYQIRLPDDPPLIRTHKGKSNKYILITKIYKIVQLV